MSSRLLHDPVTAATVVEYAPAELILSADVTDSQRSDVRLPVILTEGQANLDALDHVVGLRRPAGRPLYLPVGLTPAWRDAESESDPIPALSGLQWRDRDDVTARRAVILAFDREKESGREIRRLVNELKNWTPLVAVFAWPTNTTAAGTIATLITMVGSDHFLRLLEALSKSDCAVPVDQLASAITVSDYFAKDTGGLLYRFDGGVYRPTGEEFVKGRVKRLMNAWDSQSSWTSGIAREVAEYIRVDAPVLWDRPPDDVINVANGLLNCRTRTLAPHTPDFLSMVQLPVRFDPSAKCDMWDWFVETVFPADSRDIAWELFGWIMIPDTSQQKAVMLLGEGSNGKSAYLAGMQAFLGCENYTALSLQKVSKDRFATSQLVGKLANICPDIPPTPLAETDVFKAIVGGDRMNAERKFKPGFEFSPFAKLIYSANQPPSSGDATHAYSRRWIVIPFQRVFGEQEEVRIERKDLDSVLADSYELSGVLNRALDALDRIRETGGFTEGQSMIAAREEFRRETNQLSMWLDQNTVADTDKFVAKRRLIDTYNADCIRRCCPAMTSTAFGKALKRLCTVTEGQRTVEGKAKVECYIGIRMRGPFED